MIMITAVSWITNRYVNFTLSRDEAMDLCFGHPSFVNNFELVYNYRFAGITRYVGGHV